MKQKLIGIEIIIIDEISMLSAVMFTCIDERLRAVLDTSRPFGGIGICLSGDPYQLPSVGSPVFFSLPEEELHILRDEKVPINEKPNVPLHKHLQNHGELF